VTAVSLPFAALLKRTRLAAGLTQETLAERSGLSARAVSDLERDGERTPRLDTLALLADALGLTHERRADLFAAARPAVQPAVIGPTLTLRPDPLPAPPTPLIGREAEVAAVRSLVCSEEARLVTLTGPGGVGKTRLALDVAGAVQGTFADGVWWVDLVALTDPALVLPAVARALGLPEAAGLSLAGRLAHALRHRRLLLLLDNFEQVLAAAPAVADLLAACPKLTVLATSRAPLRLRAEREFPVPPLDLPAGLGQMSPAAASRSGAVRLFAERARAVRPNFP
jgi:transcriptional regulator with XRE-family HTH domain